ncbi:MAG TPA: hypothetical protein VHN11_00885 [Xanthobacteraceae bacterium]|nr:hypothetical protein [Xanthobacteraceae bacterium]
MRASASAHLIDRCIRIARASNGPTVLVLPKDIQNQNYEELAVAHGFTRSGIGYSKPKIVPEEADLAKAADDLSAGNKVAILVGAGARGTASDLTEMARGRSESRGLDAACSAWQRRPKRLLRAIPSL